MLGITGNVFARYLLLKSAWGGTGVSLPANSYVMLDRLLRRNCSRSQMLAEPSSNLLQRTGGDQRGTTWMKNIHDDMSSLDLGIHEAGDLAQNRPLCRLMSLHSAAHL